MIVVVLSSLELGNVYCMSGSACQIIGLRLIYDVYDVQDACIYMVYAFEILCCVVNTCDGLNDMDVVL